MAQKKISQLPVAITPLAGTEIVPIVQSGITRQTSVSNFGAVVNYTPAGVGAVTTTVQAKLRESVSVKDFGAKGDGVTDDRSAIKAAVAALQTAGGGELLFPKGDYLISTVEGSYSLPELNASLQWATSSYEVQLYFSNLNNIIFRFEGARLISSKTNGGFTLIFDGCSNLAFYDLSMQGATVMSGSTVTTTGTNALGIISLSQNSDNITFVSPKIDKHYAGIDIFGNPANSYKAKNITVDGAASIKNGEYGFACRGNGNNVRIVDAYSYRLNRPFFIYDTQNVHVKIMGDEMNGGFQALIKAYTANVFNITVDMYVANRANTQACLGIQSQHNPALQATPAYLRNLKIRYTDYSSTSGGESIRFDYYQNSTLTATTNQFLFGDIEISGKSSGGVLSGVSITSSANYGVLHMENFSAYNGYTIYTNGSGFVPSQVFTWTPADASAAALTLTSSACRYTVNHVVVGSFAITYPVNASVVSAIITGLPVKSNSTGTNCIGVTVSYTDCGFPIYGLIGANDYTISWWKNTGVAVTNQDLSGKTIRGSFVYFA